MTKQDHYTGPDLYIVQAQINKKWWTQCEEEQGHEQVTNIKEAAAFLMAVSIALDPDEVRVLLIQGDGSTKLITNDVVEIALMDHFNDGYDSYPACFEWQDACLQWSRMMQDHLIGYE